MAVPLRKIAGLAKTSVSTVSLVLNGKHYNRVSTDTRERIERIALEFGYRPNRHAQSLVRGQTKTVAILLNRLSNPFFARYVSLIEDQINDLGYHLIPQETRADGSRERELMSLHRQGVCDLVLSLAAYEPPERSVVADQSAVLRLNDWSQASPLRCPLSHVAIRYGDAFRELIRHFVASGRTSLGLVMHRNNEPFPVRKTESQYAAAVRKLLADSPLRCGPRNQVTAHENDDLKLWHDAAYELLKRHRHIDALLVHSFEQIAPVIEAARKLDRKIGQDLALATFDDPPAASWIERGITVIREPVEEVARALAERVVAQLKGEPKLPDLTINAELVIRASSRVQA